MGSTNLAENSAKRMVRRRAALRYNASQLLPSFALSLLNLGCCFEAALQMYARFSLIHLSRPYRNFKGAAV